MTNSPRYRLNTIQQNIESLSRRATMHCAVWAPCLTGLMPARILYEVRTATEHTSCRTIDEAELLAAAGFQSIIVIRPLVDLQSLVRLSSIAAQVQVTVVIDHFRHAELLSQAILPVATQVAVLLEVDLGLQSTGVRPGPDSVRLASAVAELPGLRLRGIFLDDRDVTAPGQLNVSGGMNSHNAFPERMAVAHHCLRILQANQLQCSEIVTGLERMPTDLPPGSVSTLLTSPLLMSPLLMSPLLTGAVLSGTVLTDTSPDHLVTSASPAFALTEEQICRVISRPSLEWCVINAGTDALGELNQVRITQPRGAQILHGRTDTTTLSLSGESMDLRIGDEVTVMTSGARCPSSVAIVVD